MHQPRRNRKTNYRRDRQTQCTLGTMARGASRPSDATSGTPRGVPDHPVLWIEQRFRAYIGLEVVAHGYLTEPYGGHAAGTPYVDITAACSMDREKARHILGDSAGLPQLAWECGWRAAGTEIPQLRVFPSSPAVQA